jgi:hypothetical protein
MRYDNIQKAKVKSQLENKQRQLVNKSHNSRLNTLIDRRPSSGIVEFSPLHLYLDESNTQCNVLD